MPSVAPRISILTEIFMGAAFADAHCESDERQYVRNLLCDLLCTDELPPDVLEQIANFDPQRFDLAACASDFRRDPPMSRRRLLELASYVTLSDGRVEARENAFLRQLAEALEMPPEEYEDLVPDGGQRLRDSFVELARVPVPYPTPR